MTFALSSAMALQEQLLTSSDLRNIPGLARFLVEGRATGKQLGSGSYGSVVEVCHSSNSATESQVNASLTFP